MLITYLRVKLCSITASHSSCSDFKIAGIEVAEGGFGFTRGEHFTLGRVIQFHNQLESSLKSKRQVDNAVDIMLDLNHGIRKLPL